MKMMSLRSPWPRDSSCLATVLNREREAPHSTKPWQFTTWVILLKFQARVNVIFDYFHTRTLSYHWSSLISIDYHWLSLVIIDYHWLSLIIIEYHWLSLIIIDYHWLSLVIIDYQWLSDNLKKVSHWLTDNVKSRDAGASKKTLYVYISPTHEE